MSAFALRRPCSKRRETGVGSPTELGIPALASLAQPDPVAVFPKRTRGVPGKEHTLDIWSA